MREVRDRLRALDQIQAPDLRERILSWEPRPPRTEPSFRRVGIALLAFVVGAAGIALAIRAFRAAETPPRPATTIENGKIAFVSETETELYVNGTQSGIFVMNADGSGRAALVDDPEAFEWDPAWSPDGSRIAFVLTGEAAESPMGLYVANSDGSGVTLILEDDTGPTSPSWSPDGRTIVFETGLGHEQTERGDRDVYAIDLESGELTRLTDDPARDEHPALSPDGSKIAFTRQQDGVIDIYLMKADGTGVIRLTSGFRPAWSPDGTKIAFERDADIYVTNVDGTDVTRLTEGSFEGGEPTWSPDGTKIAFRRDHDLYMMNADGTAVSRLTDTPRFESGPTWQPVPVEDESRAPTESPTPTPSEASALSVDPDPSVDVHVAPLGQASSLLYAFDSVWVAWYDDSGAKLTRIDAATNEIVATIPVEDVPGWTGGGGGIAEGFGSIWVVGGTRQGTIFQRIDAGSNQLTATIPLGGEPGSSGADVAVDQAGVWVAISEFQTGGSSSLLRVDPGTNDVTRRIPLQFEYERQVISVGGAIVVRQLHWHEDGSGPNTIFTSIDPDTGMVNANTSENAYLGVWIWNDEAWAAHWSEAEGWRFVAMDPVTLSTLGDPVPFEAERIGRFQEGEGGIWFVTAAGVDHWQQPVKVNRFNPDDGRIDVSERVPEVGGVDMAVGGGAIWFLNYDGNVLRFDLGHP